MYWAASCGGCEIAVLNIGEKILDVDANFEVVFWPVAMDAKYKDVEAMPDQSILLTLFNGGIRNKENEEIAHLLRRKSKSWSRSARAPAKAASPAWPTCPRRRRSSTPPTKASPPRTPTIFDRLYGFSMPEGDINIPKFYPMLKTLDQVVDVDYYMPGCPPESHQIAAVIDLVIQVLHGQASLPPKGAVIGAGGSTVCDDCPRQRNVKPITAFRRIQDLSDPDPDTLPAGTGHPLQRTGHPQRLRRAVPASRRPVHRLLRPGRRRAGLRRTPDHRFRLGDRQQRSRRDRAHPGWHPRPRRPVLPLQPGWLAAARR